MQGTDRVEWAQSPPLCRSAQADGRDGPHLSQDKVSQAAELGSSTVTQRCHLASCLLPDLHVLAMLGFQLRVGSAPIFQALTTPGNRGVHLLLPRALLPCEGRHEERLSLREDKRRPAGQGLPLGVGRGHGCG